MNPFQTPGAFSWCELIATDPAAAKIFYGEVLGWRFKEGQVSETPYTVTVSQSPAPMKEV